MLPKEICDFVIDIFYTHYHTAVSEDDNFSYSIAYV